MKWQNMHASIVCRCNRTIWFKFIHIVLAYRTIQWTVECRLLYVFVIYLYSYGMSYYYCFVCFYILRAALGYDMRRYLYWVTSSNQIIKQQYQLKMRTTHVYVFTHTTTQNGKNEYIDSTVLRTNELATERASEWTNRRKRGKEEIIEGTEYIYKTITLFWFGLTVNADDDDDDSILRPYYYHTTDYAYNIVQATTAQRCYSISKRLHSQRLH